MWTSHTHLGRPFKPNILLCRSNKKKGDSQRILKLYIGWGREKNRNRRRSFSFTVQFISGNRNSFRNKSLGWRITSLCLNSGQILLRCSLMTIPTKWIFHSFSNTFESNIHQKGTKRVTHTYTHTHTQKMAHLFCNLHCFFSPWIETGIHVWY